MAFCYRQALKAKARLKRATMSPNLCYRRNRDYSKQFDCAYDLKKDVYNCYLKAK